MCSKHSSLIAWLNMRTTCFLGTWPHTFCSVKLVRVSINVDFVVRNDAASATPDQFLAQPRVPSNTCTGWVGNTLRTRELICLALPSVEAPDRPCLHSSSDWWR